MTRLASALGDRLVISTGEDGTIMLYSFADMTRPTGAHTSSGGSNSSSLSHSIGGGGGGASEGEGAPFKSTSVPPSSSSVLPGGSSSSSSSTGLCGPVCDPDGGNTPLRWADEILVTRSEITALKEEAASLKTTVDAAAATEYHLERAVGAAHALVLAEKEDAFTAELEKERRLLTAVRERTKDSETKFAAQVAAARASSVHELVELEGVFSKRLAAEVARYDALVAARDGIAAEFETGLEKHAREHAAEMASIRARYERFLAADDTACNDLEHRRAEIGAEATSAAGAMEADVDRELRGVRSRMEDRLAEEAKSTLLLRGENGFMKRRYVTLSKELAEQGEDINSLSEKERELGETISALQKDVAGHKKEIREREETVEDKESRIYDLKKKNQVSVVQYEYI